MFYAINYQNEYALFVNAFKLLVFQLLVSNNAISFSTKSRFSDLSLQQSLRFKLVNELSVSPSSLTMFNYEEGSRDLSVEGGSGSFVTTSDNESVVRMSSVDSTPITVSLNHQYY